MHLLDGGIWGAGPLPRGETHMIDWITPSRPGWAHLHSGLGGFPGNRTQCLPKNQPNSFVLFSKPTRKQCFPAPWWGPFNQETASASCVWQSPEKSTRRGTGLLCLGLRGPTQSRGLHGWRMWGLRTEGAVGKQRRQASRGPPACSPSCCCSPGPHVVGSVTLLQGGLFISLPSHMAPWSHPGRHSRSVLRIFWVFSNLTKLAKVNKSGRQC